jgi:hypothetical protein
VRASRNPRGSPTTGRRNKTTTIYGLISIIAVGACLIALAAYWLLDELRRRLVGMGIRRMQLDTLGLTLIKIGGRVRQSTTKVRLHLASGHPGQRLWNVLMKKPSIGRRGVKVDASA